MKGKVREKERKKSKNIQTNNDLTYIRYISRNLYRAFLLLRKTTLVF